MFSHDITYAFSSECWSYKFNYFSTKIAAPLGLRLYDERLKRACRIIYATKNHFIVILENRNQGVLYASHSLWLTFD